jgi:phage baseplate assembly protein V
MMKAMLNAVRLQAQRAVSNIVTSRVGSVTSYDPSTMTAIVQLQPDGDLTGWLPVSSAWIGNGWGMFAPPNSGDLVDVVYINGDLNAGTIVGRFYMQGQALAVQSGEFWLVHESGAFFKLLNSGALTISDAHGASITLNGDGSITSAASEWNHTGTVNFTGNVNVSETLTATNDVIGGGISLKTHPHGGVQTGDGVSGPPIA